MKNQSVFKILILLTTLISSSLAFAHSGAMGIVKQRMDAMSDIGKNMKIIGTMIKDQQIEALTLAKAALKIQMHASQISELFPKGSTEKPSEVLPVIWTNWDEFIEIANKLDTNSGRLAEIATNSRDTNAIKTQFQLVAKSCIGCHEKFRLKK